MEGTQMKRNDPYDTGSGAEPTSFMPPAGRIDHGTTRGDSGLEGAPKKAPVQAMLATAVILLAVASGVLLYQYRRTSAAERLSRDRYVEAFNAIAEIQDSLNAITVQEGLVRMRPEGFTAEERLTAPNRREVLESIALLNESIQRTKDKIGQLESSLQSSGIKIASLQGMIVHLKQAVKAKQQQVALLSDQVETLQTKVTGLETTVADDQREMATISYVIGTKKELENSGVIVAKGGVLGLGKTVQLTGNLDQTLVSELNTDEETIVRANATKAKVLSPQPPSSYELTLVGGQMELRILDPKEFRKVKHLIIMTA